MVTSPRGKLFPSSIRDETDEDESESSQPLKAWSANGEPSEKQQARAARASVYPTAEGDQKYGAFIFDFRIFLTCNVVNVTLVLMWIFFKYNSDKNLNVRSNN